MTAQLSNNPGEPDLLSGRVTHMTLLARVVDAVIRSIQADSWQQCFRILIYVVVFAAVAVCLRQVGII
jgi:hypothetical protein